MEEKLLRVFDESKNDFKIKWFDTNTCICTGLTDSKDKLIFEGDILGIEEEDSNEEEEKVIVKYTGIVQFDEGAFTIRLLHGGYWDYDDDLSHIINNSNILSVYVIGNIFQDKDILEINNK
jgi:uncharacterized phage protein (TIGR01671 family)